MRTRNPHPIGRPLVRWSLAVMYTPSGPPFDAAVGRRDGCDQIRDSPVHERNRARRRCDTETRIRPGRNVFLRFAHRDGRTQWRV
jgi:hypothetical protein